MPVSFSLAPAACRAVAASLLLAAVPALAQTPAPSQTQSPSQPQRITPPPAAAPTAKPALAAGQLRLKVDATILLGSETLGTPTLVAKAGEEFGIKLGQEGKQRVSLSGMTAPINDRNVALDYTLELEQWVKEGSRVWRTTQSVKIAYGERFIVAGIKDAEGRELRMEIAVSREAQP